MRNIEDGVGKLARRGIYSDRSQTTSLQGIVKEVCVYEKVEAGDHCNICGIQDYCSLLIF